MLYDVPGRTGSQIALETYEAMASWEPVVAVKDAVGDLPRGQARADGLRPLLRRRRQHPRVPRPRRVRPRVGRRPRRRQRAGLDDLDVPGRRPRRSPGDLPAPAARLRGGHGRRQLRRHHGQGGRSSCSACSTTGTSAHPWRRSTTTRSPRSARGLVPPASSDLRAQPRGHDLAKDLCESPAPRTVRPAEASRGRLAGHPARRSRRGRSQHDRLRVRRPTADRRLRRAVPRGPPPRGRPDPP